MRLHFRFIFTLFGTVIISAAGLRAAAVSTIRPPAGAAYTMRLESGGEAARVRVGRSPVAGGYMVVVSRETWQDLDWREVARGLAVKHGGAILVHAGPVSEVRAELAKRMPRYTCFVARPQEAGRAFVAAVHRLTRRLNDDPYTDTLWGILTGYTARQAARIAAETRPLNIRRAAAGTSLSLDAFDEGIWYDEGRKNHAMEKIAGGTVRDITCPDDTTAALVDVFNAYRPDLFVTSGHATERGWQIGYSYPNGLFRGRDGVLRGVDMAGKDLPIDSPNPRVYLAMGNCLMGHIVDDQAMALAFMGSGGVDQMIGYTVETWYGYGGWGVGGFFLDQPGRFTLAESFFLAHQALLQQIEARFPQSRSVDFDVHGPSGAELPRLAAALKVRGMEGEDKDHLGLMWDRDTVAFYGDPAWEARLPRRAPPWEQVVTTSKGRVSITLRSASGTECGRPPAVLLPRRIRGARVLEGKEFQPVIGEWFVMLPGLMKIEPGRTYRVVLAGAGDTRGGSAPHSPKPGRGVAQERRPDVAAALEAAGGNREELLAALRSAPTDQRDAVAFLIANMPARDLATLTKGFILENVRLAFQARKEAPWGKRIPDGIFLNDVLPYANVSEPREDWRADFRRRFAAAAHACKTPSEAALVLNREVFETLQVAYHPTKRPKPDQSPSESMAAHFASCTGLSILLVDACRAVGVPARLVGTPSWTLVGETHVTAGGNHTWVEIWDDGWQILGAAEPSPLNDTWFLENARRADTSNPIHRIYAVSFRKTPVPFPMVWDEGATYVSAEDVTARYKSKAAPAPPPTASDDAS